MCVELWNSHCIWPSYRHGLIKNTPYNRNSIVLEDPSNVYPGVSNTQTRLRSSIRPIQNHDNTQPLLLRPQPRSFPLHPSSTSGHPNINHRPNNNHNLPMDGRLPPLPLPQRRLPQIPHPLPNSPNPHTPFSAGVLPNHPDRIPSRWIRTHHLSSQQRRQSSRPRPSLQQWRSTDVHGCMHGV